MELLAVPVENYRGESNLYKNAVLNCIAVLKKLPRELGIEIREYYEENVANPITPSFSVLVVSSNDEQRSSQNLTQIRYTINIGMEIWYFYGDLTENTKRNEITYTLWEINEYLKTNKTLNGFVPKLGVDVLGARWVPQARGDRILAGGVISLVVRKLYTSTITH